MGRRVVQKIYSEQNSEWHHWPQKFISVPSLLSLVEILVVAGRVEGMEDWGRESMVLQEVLAHLKMLSGRRRCTPSVLVIPYATHSMEQACMLKLSRICLAFPAPHWGFRALPGVHQWRPPPGRPGWIRKNSGKKSARRHGRIGLLIQLCGSRQHCLICGPSIAVRRWQCFDSTFFSSSNNWSTPLPGIHTLHD